MASPRDTRKYNTSRLPSLYGYSDPPVIDDTLPSRLPLLAQRTGRLVQIGRSQFCEIWSPNSAIHPYLPGVVPPGFDFSIPKNPCHRRYDGHLGRFDYTVAPQMFSEKQPWRGLIRRPSRAGESDPEFVFIGRVWKPLSSTDDWPKRLPQTYTDDLRKCVLYLQSSSLNNDRIVSSRPSVWKNRPKLPTNAEIDELAVIDRFDEAVDRVVEVQRRIKDFDAWNRYVHLFLDEYPTGSVEVLLRNPQISANDEFLGAWINGAPEVDVLHALHWKVPCFIAHVLSKMEGLSISMRDASTSLIDCTDVTLLDPVTNGYDFIAGRALQKPTSFCPTLRAAPPSLDPRLRALSASAMHGWSGRWSSGVSDSKKWLKLHPPLPLSPMPSKDSTSSDGAPGAFPLDTVVLDDMRVSWIRPPPVMDCPKHDKTSHWLEGTMDGKDGMKEVAKSRSLRECVWVFDRERKRKLYFHDTIEPPPGAVSDPQVFGFPLPSMVFLNKYGKKVECSRWVYYNERPLPTDTNRLASIPPSSSLPLLSSISIYQSRASDDEDTNHHDSISNNPSGAPSTPHLKHKLSTPTVIFTDGSRCVRGSSQVQGPASTIAPVVDVVQLGPSLSSTTEAGFVPDRSSKAVFSESSLSFSSPTGGPDLRMVQIPKLMETFESKPGTSLDEGPSAKKLMKMKAGILEEDYQLSSESATTKKLGPSKTTAPTSTEVAEIAELPRGSVFSENLQSTMGVVAAGTPPLIPSADTVPDTLLPPTRDFRISLPDDKTTYLSVTSFGSSNDWHVFLTDLRNLGSRMDIVVIQVLRSLDKNGTHLAWISAATISDALCVRGNYANVVFQGSTLNVRFVGRGDYSAATLTAAEAWHHQDGFTTSFCLEREPPTSKRKIPLAPRSPSCVPGRWSQGEGFEVPFGRADSSPQHKRLCVSDPPTHHRLRLPLNQGANGSAQIKGEPFSLSHQTQRQPLHSSQKHRDARPNLSPSPPSQSTRYHRSSVRHTRSPSPAYNPGPRARDIHRNSSPPRSFSSRSRSPFQPRGRYRSLSPRSYIPTHNPSQPRNSNRGISHRPFTRSPTCSPQRPKNSYSRFPPQPLIPPLTQSPPLSRAYRCSRSPKPDTFPTYNHRHNSPSQDFSPSPRNQLSRPRGYHYPDGHNHTSYNPPYPLPQIMPPMTFAGSNGAHSSHMASSYQFSPTSYQPLPNLQQPPPFTLPLSQRIVNHIPGISQSPGVTHQAANAEPPSFGHAANNVPLTVRIGEFVHKRRIRRSQPRGKRAGVGQKLSNQSQPQTDHDNDQ